MDTTGEATSDKFAQERNSDHEGPLGDHLVHAKCRGKHGRVILQESIDWVEWPSPGRDILPLPLGVELCESSRMFGISEVQRDRADL